MFVTTVPSSRTRVAGIRWRIGRPASSAQVESTSASRQLGAHVVACTTPVRDGWPVRVDQMMEGRAPRARVTDDVARIGGGAGTAIAPRWDRADPPGRSPARLIHLTRDGIASRLDGTHGTAFDTNSAATSTVHPFAIPPKSSATSGGRRTMFPSSSTSAQRPHGTAVRSTSRAPAITSSKSRSSATGGDERGQDGQIEETGQFTVYSVEGDLKHRRELGRYPRPRPGPLVHRRELARLKEPAEPLLVRPERRLDAAGSPRPSRLRRPEHRSRRRRPSPWPGRCAVGPTPLRRRAPCWPCFSVTRPGAVVPNRRWFSSTAGVVTGAEAIAGAALARRHDDGAGAAGCALLDHDVASRRDDHKLRTRGHSRPWDRLDDRPRQCERDRTADPGDDLHGSLAQLAFLRDGGRRA